MVHCAMSAAGAEGMPLGAVVLPAGGAAAPGTHRAFIVLCLHADLSLMFATSLSAAGAEGTPLGAVVLPAGGAATPGTHRASGRRTRPTPPGGRR
jgi:hypothetical protein